MQSYYPHMYNSWDNENIGDFSFDYSSGNSTWQLYPTPPESADGFEYGGFSSSPGLAQTPDLMVSPHSPGIPFETRLNSTFFSLPWSMLL